MLTGWQYELSAKASKELSKLPKATQQMIVDYLLERVLESNNPRDFGKALRHDKFGLWRYRVANYHIICQIQKSRLIILVIKIGKRDVVYHDR